MSIKSLLFILFLYVCLVWVGAAYFYSGAELRQTGLLWTGAGLLALLLLLLASRLMAWWRGRRAAKAAAPKTRRIAPEPVHEQDAALRSILAEAKAALGKIPAYAATRGGDPLATVPMYLLIGPQDSGKTATFLNSGVEPTMLTGQASDNLNAAARPCTLWLARNTVFVEISGRVFSGDAARWTETLRLLRGGEPVSRWQALRGIHPTTANLRGVVAFCDTKEFTSAPQDPQRFERYCKTFQERLRAIGEVFGAGFPVYQVIAKADGIPYFADFFQRLPESEAGQVLGCTLPLAKHEAAGPAADAEAQRLASSFRQLYHSLAERRMAHLAHEPDPRRRPGVYEFPRELKRIRTPLVQFLTDVFRPHPLRPGPVLRGFYLTGVREVEVAEGSDPRGAEWSVSPSMEGTKLFRAADATQLFRASDATQLLRTADPAKARMAASARRLVLRWMFATDLFHGVVLADRVPVAPPPRPRPYERERRAVLAGICAVSALLCLVFGLSWWRNRQLLAKVGAVTDVALQRRQNVATMADLEAIDNLRAEIVYLREGASLSYHWGLYSGDRILPAAREAYFRRFQQLLLNDLNADLVGMLRAASSSSDAGQYDSVYRALKAHLMITSGTCQPNAATAAQALREARQRIMPAASAPWQALADRQINFYASELPYGNPCRLTEDAAARDHARDYFRRVKGVDRIYNSVLASAAPAVPKAQTLADLAPNYRQVLNGPAEVPPVYSRSAWDAVQRASKEAGSGSLGEACVVGGADPAGGKFDAGLSGAIQRMYISDYIERWRKYVAGFSVIRYESAADAARKLEILSDHGSPLLALFALAGNQTNFPQAASDAGFLEKAPVIGSLVKNAAKAKQQVNALTGTEPAGPAQIGRAFQPVQWVVPPGGETWISDRNAAYVDALAQLGHSMQAIARGAGTPDPAVHQAAAQAYDKAMEASRQISRGFRPAGVAGLDEAAQRLLEEPILLAKRFILTDMDKAAGDKINGELRSFCAHAQPVLRRYPFLPSSAEDVSLEQLTALFAPGSGEIWKFQAQSLADLVVKDGSQWKVKDPAKKPQVSPELLAFLNRAQAISDAFFPAGATQPQFTYTLRPKLESSFKDSILELEIDGRTHQWTTGLQKQFSWPAPAGTKDPGAVARIRSGAVVFGFASRGGLWGIFRIMADAEPRNPGARLVEWKYVRGGNGRLDAIQPAPVRIEIVDFPGGVDLFNPRYFDGFGCPVKAVR